MSCDGDIDDLGRVSAVLRTSSDMPIVLLHHGVRYLSVQALAIIVAWTNVIDDLLSHRISHRIINIDRLQQLVFYLRALADFAFFVCTTCLYSFFRVSFAALCLISALTSFVL